MSSDETSLGQIAYDAYRFTWPHPAHRLWHELTESEREAWRAAANAVGELRHVEQRRLTFKHDTAVTAIEIAPLGPKGVVPTLHAKTGDVLVCSPDGGEVYVQRDGEHVARYVDDGRGVLRPVMS
jgi:hypothetical protein